MIMSDKRLKVCLRGAAVFLAVSIVFCIAVICGVNIQKSNMEKRKCKCLRLHRSRQKKLKVTVTVQQMKVMQ